MSYEPLYDGAVAMRQYESNIVKCVCAAISVIAHESSVAKRREMEVTTRGRCVVIK